MIISLWVGSGKSVLAQKIIKMWKFKFDVIAWICPTYGLQEHSLIEDATGIVAFERFSLQNLELIKTHQEARNKKREEEGKPKSRMLLILDDNVHKHENFRKKEECLIF